MKKTRLLFVCHGNICRSPMAEFVMKELVKRAGCEEKFEIASAATSTEEIGNEVYPLLAGNWQSMVLAARGRRHVK